MLKLPDLCDIITIRLIGDWSGLADANINYDD